MSLHSRSNMLRSVSTNHSNQMNDSSLTLLDVLESSCVAWPNAAMWRQASSYDLYTGPVHAAFNGLRQVSAESSNVSMPDVESRKASNGSGIL